MEIIDTIQKYMGKISMIDDFDLNIIVEPLQNWFAGHKRILPWRENPRPYDVWISEIMLQQTRVEAVKPYFERFIQELPDVKTLAECEEDRYLKLWEGLGYYNRVRNLNAAAKQIMEDYGGIVPDEYEKLLTLKGIGHYTAGAICSIAYGKAVPAVDGNVFRVITRLTADDSDIMKQSVKNHFEEKISQLMVEQEKAGILIPSQFNQALMELGALICTPNGKPHCMECPWKEFCRARQQGKIEMLPVKSKAKQRRIEEKTVLVIRDGDKVAIHKRPQKGLLAGLYELPNVCGFINQEEVLSYVKELGCLPLRIKPLIDAKHIFSHVEWHMKGYVIFVEPTEVQKCNAKQELLFVEAYDAKERYAIPTAFLAYAEYMNLEIGAEAVKNSRKENL